MNALRMSRRPPAMARRMMVLTLVAAIGMLMGASGVSAAAPGGKTSATAITLTTNATPTVFRASGAYRDTITSGSCFVPDGHVVWFTWVATDTTTFSASTFGSNYDTIVFVYDSGMALIGCNDQYDFGVDCAGGNNCSKVVFSAAIGETYFIAVAAYDSLKGGKGEIQVSD